MTEENQEQELEFAATDAVVQENHEIQSIDSLSAEELLDKARESLVLIPATALKILNQIKPVLSKRLEEDRNREQSESDTEEFEFSKDQLEKDFNQIIQTAQEARVEEKKRIELEKADNLNKKKALLKTLAELVEEDETEQSIKRVKEIQSQWKEIKLIPHEEQKSLWDKYHRLLDEFYDKHSINIELKELDRKKNLEVKIELTKKVEALLQEPSIRRSYSLLNKYHEEFRNTGPVPRESREGIWEAFKKVTEEVYQQKKAAQDEIQAQREENLNKKTLLLDKLRLMADIPFDSTKKWNQKSKELDEIFENWKKIGPVPKSQSDAIWMRFKQERSKFQAGRKAFFAELNNARKDNLKLKRALCEKVEALKEEEDFQSTAKKIIKIQEDWKNIGPVPDKENKAIWARFRAACDYFFDRRKQSFEDKREEEEANLQGKKVILDALKHLVESDKNEQESFAIFKELSQKWKTIGYVPQKNAKKINSSFDKLGDQIFAKFKKDPSQLKQGEWLEHYQQMAEAPNGNSRIKDSLYHLKKKRNTLNQDVMQMEQNLSFFNSSSADNPLLKDVEKRLNNARKKLEKMDAELKVLKSIQRKLQD